MNSSPRNNAITNNAFLNNTMNQQMNNDNARGYANNNATRNNAAKSNVKMGNNAEVGNNGAGILKIVAVVIVMIIIVILTFWIVNKLRKGNRSENDLLEERKYFQLDDNSVIPKRIDTSKMPSPANNNEMTYNFWIHIADNYDQTTRKKIIFYRGTLDNESNNDVKFAQGAQGPIVVLDNKTNKLMIAVATKNNTNITSLDSIFANDGNSGNGSYLKTYIDYIPLQRWVNICIMIVENSMRIYLDGDIYSVVTTNEMKSIAALNPSEEDLTISHSKPNYQAKGHITNVKYFNYMLSHNYIRGIYKRGPFPRTWLSLLGINKYGVQSPIYKIE